MSSAPGPLCWLGAYDRRSSRQTAVTVTSAISLLIGVSLGKIAGGDARRYGALAAATAPLGSRPAADRA